MTLTQIMSYFEKDGDTYHIKKGYICTIGHDYISMIMRSKDSGLTLYSMASDNKYVVDTELVAHIHIHSITEVL